MGASFLAVSVLVGPIMSRHSRTAPPSTQSEGVHGAAGHEGLQPLEDALADVLGVELVHLQ